jgi:drug/metabolite transporter (DMT)-like permease
LIDAASFTAVRLVSGACVLFGLASLRLVPARGATQPSDEGVLVSRDWLSILALFGYAAPFSYAYSRLSAGTGALLLFGSVQATMLSGSLLSGERPSRTSWLGWVIALVGLVGLSWPGVSAPDPWSALLMGIAGLAWGVYSLRGRTLRRDPLRSTATYFVWASLPALALWLVSSALGATHVLPSGAGYAVASGALASGIGYSVWYVALRKLTASTAALLQLLVPVLAAMFGVLCLGEAISLRLAACSASILGGVALSLLFSGRAPEGTLPLSAKK